MDKIINFSAGDTIITASGASSQTAITSVNAVGSTYTSNGGFLKGIYSSTANTFTFASTGATDTLYVFDLNGDGAGTDLYGIVLVAYLDTGTTDTFGSTSTSGLVGVA